MSNLMFTPLMQIAMSIITILVTLPNVERILDLYNDKSIENVKENNTEYKLYSEPTSINISNLYFRYSKREDYLFKGANLFINKGENIAILGESGIGKTTLINLLLGIETDYKGSIFFDNILNSNLDKDDLIKDIGYVSQDNVLFNGHFSDFLNIFLENYSEKDLDNTIQKMSLEKLFSSLNINSNLYIEDSGSNFSGGQKQRLSLIRLFLKEYSILLLDEPTSNLDKPTAKKVTEELLKLNSTKIFITHDPDILKNMDKIYEIKDSSIKLVKERYRENQIG